MCSDFTDVKYVRNVLIKPYLHVIGLILWASYALRDWLITRKYRNRMLRQSVHSAICCICVNRSISLYQEVQRTHNSVFLSWHERLWHRQIFQILCCQESQDISRQNRANSKAWMTSATWEDYFKILDRKNAWCLLVVPRNGYAMACHILKYFIFRHYRPTPAYGC